MALEHISSDRGRHASFSYQFSFESRADWSRVYAPGSELKGYAEHCVDKYGVRDRIRFGTRITGARSTSTTGSCRSPTAVRRAGGRFC